VPFSPGWTAEESGFDYGQRQEFFHNFLSLKTDSGVNPAYAMGIGSVFHETEVAEA
jgi:hypothetical protein